MSHEDAARRIPCTGYSCSNSVDWAFSDVNRAVGSPPAPRNIAGRCGALLAAQKVLRDLGVDREDELEQAFEKGLGYVTCVELKRHRCNCNDCVGVAVQLKGALAQPAGGLGGISGVHPPVL